MQALVSVAVCFIATSESCHAKGGWGQEGILIPKPTLIPKLAAAFHDGKKSVNLSKGKPLIYHKFKTDSFKTDGWSGGSTKSNLNGLVSIFLHLTIKPIYLISQIVHDS